MQRAAAIPYYTSGAATGLALGYLYAWLQVLQLIPGLGWATDMIRSILPKDHTAQQYSSTAGMQQQQSCTAGSSSNSPARAAVASAQPVGAAHVAAVLQPQQQQQQQQPLQGETLADVELSSGSFAVMDAGALGSALYEMERPTNTAAASNNSSSDLLPPTPHPSFQTASNPAATSPGAAAAAAETADTATSPGAAAAAGGDGIQIDQMQLMLSSLRDRLASFPLDNMSPTTTATALSLYSNLPPAGSSEYGGDEPSPEIDLAVGPVEPVEGDLDFTVTNSTGSNLLPPETPTAAADVPGGSSSSTTVLPKPGDTVVPLLAVSGDKRATAGATVKFAPGVTGSPIPSGVTSGVTTYPTAEQQQQQRSLFSGTGHGCSSVPLTVSAVQERERRGSNSCAAPAAAVAMDISDDTDNTLGGPRAANAVGLPAQRVVVTKLGRTGSTTSSTTSSPRRYFGQQQQQHQGSPAAAALNASTAAAAAGSARPGALQPPRLPSAHAAVAVPAVAYSAAAAGSSNSAHIPAAAGEASKLLASSSSIDGSNGDDRRPVKDTPPSASMTIQPRAGAQGGVRALNLQPSTPASTSATAAAGVNGSPRSMHSMSSIRTTDSAGTVERKKQKGLLSMLKSKAMKGRQQVR